MWYVVGLLFWTKIDAAAAGSATGADTAAGLAVGSPLFKLERLIVDWPFNFQCFAIVEDQTLNEQLAIASVNEALLVERQREHFRFSSHSMMQVCVLAHFV